MESMLTGEIDQDKKFEQVIDAVSTKEAAGV